MGENPPEEDFSKLSIEDLVVHKSWKARQTGFTKAVTFFGQLEPKDPKFGNFLGMVKRFVEDSNVMALEKGLEAMIAFAENAAVAPKTAGEVCPIIVQKSVGNTKAKIREKAQELLLVFVEIEKQDVVIESLIAGLQNKNPKAVSACVQTITMAVNQFGAKPLGGVKNIASQLSPLLEHKDPGVRDETKILAIELFRWVGAAFMPLLSNLKPIQKTELQAEFDALKSEGAPVAVRYLRSQKASVMTSGAAGDNHFTAPSTSREPEAAAADPWEFMTLVDVLANLPSNFYEQLESKKWSERKEPLEKLAENLKDQKLDTKAQYGEIVSVLKRIIGKDSNILVVASAGSCVTGLALGLRKKFGPFAPMIAPVLLEKFKDKKPVVVKSMTQAIDSVAKTTTLEALLEDIVAALENKSPSIKIQTALFLSRFMSTAKKDNVPKKVLKTLTTALIKVINDPDQEVRESAAAALGAAMKMAGEKAFLPFISDIAEDHLKMEKIKEFYTKAMEDAGSDVVSSMVQSVHKTLDTGASSAGGAASTKPVAGGVRAPGRRTQPGVKPVGGKNPLKVKKEAAKTRASSTGRGAASENSKRIQEEIKVPEERELTQDEAKEKAEELFAADARTELESAQWKDRISGIEKIMTAVKCMPSSDVPTQVIIRFVNKKKENNFQVLNLKLDLFLLLARECPFTATSFSLILGDILDKISDSKHGAACKQLLLVASEALSFKHVSEKVMDEALTLKNPKCQSESISWLSGALKEFGLDINLKQAIDFDQKALSATNPAVRTAAVEFAGVLYLFVGEKLRTFFEGEKSALLQAIENEFKKYAGQKAPAPSKKWKLSKAVSKNNPAGGDNDGETEEPEEEDEEQEKINAADLLPRKDISEQITDELLEEMANSAWKSRESGLERVRFLISEAKFVSANLGSLPDALRARLGDSNRNLAQTALSICEQLAKAVGPRIRDHVRTVAPGIIYLLGDSKPNIRQNAVNCLNCWVDQCGLNEFLEGEILPTAFKKTNPMLTAELLKWLSDKLDKVGKKKIPTADLKQCVPSVLSALEDRNPDVRKQSQEAILPFMKVVGFQPMQRYCMDLKPPSSNTVQAILDKARANLPSAAQPTKEIQAPHSDIDSESSSSRSVAAKGTPKAKTSTRASSSTRKPGEGSKSKKDGEDSFEGGALIDTQQKQQRFQEEKSMKILKWQFTVPGEELVEQLKNQLSSVCKPALLIQMFHSDFKQHLKAIEALTTSLDLCPDAVLGCSDLLLKWCTLRFFDTNPSVLLKCLDFIKQMQQLQLDQDVELHDFEVSAFVPFLLIKAGEPKEMVRAEVRDILDKLCNLYPSSKLFPMIMEGLKTKNSRQKAECLMRMASMIEIFGLSVCGSPQQALKVIAQSIGERDKDVRNGALTCLVAAYMHVGERVYKYIGNINEKDAVMLEERIKRSTKNRPLIKKPSPPQEKRLAAGGTRGRTPIRGGAAGKPETNGVDHDNSDEAMDTESETEQGGGRKSRQRPQGMFKLNFEELGAESDDSVECKMPKLIDHSEVDDILNKKVELPQIKTRGLSPSKRRTSVTSTTSLSSMDASSALDTVINQVTSICIPSAIQALAQLDELMKEGKSEVLRGKVDQILMALYFQYRLGYSTHMAENKVPKIEVVGLYRMIGEMLLSLLQHEELAKEATEGPLKDLACQLLTVLLDDRLSKAPEGGQVVKSINLLVVKLVERTDPTVCLVAFFRLMRESLESQTASPKFTELVMKCIWKHNRRLSSAAGELDLTKILTEAHRFFIAFPLVSWKQKAEDTPLRTMKTVLVTLVRATGDKILDHVGGIENPENSEVVAYLKKALRDVAKNPPPQSDKKAENGEGAMTVSTAGEVLSEATNRQLSAEPQLPGSVPETNHSQTTVLAQIFRKIADKENSKEGIRELYQFKRNNPGADISSFMNKSSQFFRDYIDRSLKQVEAERWSLSNGNRARGESPEVTGSVPSAYLEKLQEVRTKCGLAPSEVIVKRKTTSSDDEVVLPKLRTGGGPSSVKSETPNRPLPTATSADLGDLKRRLDMIKRQQ